MTTNTVNVSTPGDKPLPNVLKNSWDSGSIAKIEASFRTGHLSAAMKKCPEIERRSKLSPTGFAKEYRKELRPVVVEGLLDEWPALEKWTWDYLITKCGDASVVVDSYNSQKARRASFAEFVGMLRESQEANRQPIYLQEWLYMASCPQLAEDLPELPIAQYDFRRNLFGEKISTNHQLWIGQKGATTRVHQDSYCIDVMHAQILGEKHWCIMGPEAYLGLDGKGEFDFAGLADDRRTQMMHCVLRPGDVLYLPAQWWHRIELLSDSIGQGRKCLDEANLQRYMHLRFAELLALALNHDYIKNSHPELYNVVVLRNKAWARLMNIDLTKLRP
jgi:hypothetical protein